MKSQDTYTLEKVIETENFIIRIHRPVLTEDERERRMKQIHKAAESLLKEVERVKGRCNH